MRCIFGAASRPLSLVAILMLCCVTLIQPSAMTLAQDTTTQPPVLETACFYRPTMLSQPWVGTEVPCLEDVINDLSLGELAFTALAVSPDNTLYATRPYEGSVYAFTDSDGDYLPDSPRLVADGLTLPNGLAWHEGALYIAGGAYVYRLGNDALTTLVDDLPVGEGFWTGGIAVGGDRIYVTTGAPCDFCVPDDPARGAVLSFDLDGNDRQIVATGLRQPSDLAFLNGVLYVVDSARDGLFNTPDLDEINRVEPGAFFGFPYCVGANVPDLPGGDCARAVSPVVTLPTASTPLGMTAYTSDLIPDYTGKLLVALGGSYNQIELRGFSLAAVSPDDGMWRVIMPSNPSVLTHFTVEEMSYRGSGVWPHRPYDVAVNDWGWVYISVGGGRILAFRPQSPNP